ncbi:BgTH12-03210 [Blumeria graminis f. sp. triticale]|uniref:BgTH12-03210 n=1 Tax=Blumeria graminis f. sp. triticale TaxID=1689686 RepID=A0A9W4DKQ0_BLUGR|nr:BgTH12-03210 [Blumeria graminis f. sp. triticale]
MILAPHLRTSKARKLARADISRQRVKKKRK